MNGTSGIMLDLKKPLLGKQTVPSRKGLHTQWPRRLSSFVYQEIIHWDGSEFQTSASCYDHGMASRNKGNTLMLERQEMQQ